MPATLEVIAMKCPNCGAALEVTPDLETFACAYCGSAIKVARRGGTISLVRMVQAIGSIKTSTERIAAEMALKRLKHELAGVKAEIAIAESELQMAQGGLRPLKSFDAGYPIKISGDFDWSASPRHELVALIKWAAIAIALGMMFGFATFVILIVVSWCGILVSRKKRIREISEHNSQCMSVQRSIQSQLGRLHDRANSIERQVQEQRMIVETDTRPRLC